MVKFTKQYEGQLVPEWKEAFVDYWQLKKDLKKIHLLNNQPQNQSYSHIFLSSLRKHGFLEHKQTEHSIIQVHRKFSGSASKRDLYETQVMEQLGDHSDAAVEFFACLDRQLNKVNQFFKTKENEFLERGESLKKQMGILVEHKTAIKEKRAKGHFCPDEDSVSGTISCDEESIRTTTETEQDLNNSTNDFDKSNVDFSDSEKSCELEKRKPISLSGRLVNGEGKDMGIHNPLTTLSRSFSSISYFLWDDLNNQSSKNLGAKENKLLVNRKKLRHAEKMIRGAFVELYKGLGYLKTYRNLNMLAFVKILKKFDKVTKKHVLPTYLRVVETSYFNISDKALKLEDEIEELFLKHFGEDNKRKAMKYLKPIQRKESHSITFFIGLFTGCFVAFFVGYVTMARITGMYGTKSDAIYMETVYPVLSMFCLLFLHLFVYGCDIFIWRKTRVNYSFILELSTTNELKYRDVFLICTTTMAAVIGIMFVHLALVANGFSYAQVQSIPGYLLLGSILVMVCPFNIIYKSSRYRFLSVIKNIVLSPLYKVVLLDSFMADQLCSQVPTLRELEHVACYYITKSYKTQDYQYCTRTTYYRDLAYAVSFLPYYWRAMQCVRRWLDEGHNNHLANLGKYVSAMLAAGVRMAYEKKKTTGWLCLAVATSSGATIYQLYWDFVKDWGLLQFNSKNPWLRDDLMLRKKFIYYISMGLNLVLRLAWLQTVFHYNFGKVDYRVTMLFLAALEVVRRGQWNFYRLENEHLNNAGKFRAVKTVPLPFHEEDEQE